jgi:hypothetical protein
MAFIRRFDICHMQVLVMDPNLIPSSVNVVIGENLYELKFWVELAAEVSNPQLMEMDHYGERGLTLDEVPKKVQVSKVPNQAQEAVPVALSLHAISYRAVLLMQGHMALGTRRPSLF